jgi:hypothetical protein
MKMKFLLPLKWVACAGFLAALALPARAQFWEKKPWQQWTRQECDKMLTDSPWARKFTTSEVRIQASGIRTGGTQERETQPTIEYIAHLRSALPVRQAVVRLMQIQTRYDRMSDAEKRNFDKQAADYLNQDFSNRVVVHIIYQSNITALQQGLDDTWRASSTDLPAETYLISGRGERIELMRFIPPAPQAPEFELIFPKLRNGEPILSPSDRRFQIQLPVINKSTPASQTLLSGQLAYTGTALAETRMLFEFDVQKMMFNGKLEY